MTELDLNRIRNFEFAEHDSWCSVNIYTAGECDCHKDTAEALVALCDELAGLLERWHHAYSGSSTAQDMSFVEPTKDALARVVRLSDE